MMPCVKLKKIIQWMQHVNKQFRVSEITDYAERKY